MIVKAIKYITDTAGDVISGLAGTSIDSVARLWIDKPDNTYQAEFGNAGDHLSRFNHGIAATGHQALTKKQSQENVALFGPTGSGKSATVIISSFASIARGKSSIVVNDVSGGEIYDRTSSFAFKKGYRVLRLDFSDSPKSQTFNPFDYCKTISDTQKQSLLIYKNATSSGDIKGDPFWENASIMLLSLFTRYLVLYAEPKYRTLQNLLRLIEKFASDTTQTIDKMFLKTRDEELINSYKATIAMGEKTLSSVVATARTALALLYDKEVCKTTATNSIDFNLLRDERVALYICTPLKDQQYFRPITALFFQSLFSFLISRKPNNKNERSVFVLLDEFATMRFPNISATISNIRKFNASLLLCMQDEMALSVYGAAEAHQIKTNCGCKIYLPGQPLHTCAELSRILGKHTYEDHKTGAEKVRELMTPDEIRMCQDAIVLIGNNPPLKCKTVPYYRNMWLRQLNNQMPYPIVNIAAENPPLISFESM